MTPKETAEYYKSQHKTFAIARHHALSNIVNRSDMYRPSNKFVDDFWVELKKLY